MTAYQETPPIHGIKIRCANRYWSRAVQLLLQKHINARWLAHTPIPWSTFRLFIVVRWSKHVERWILTWAAESDFDAIPLPEWDAKALIAAAPKDIA